MTAFSQGCTGHQAFTDTGMPGHILSSRAIESKTRKAQEGTANSVERRRRCRWCWLRRGKNRCCQYWLHRLSVSGKEYFDEQADGPTF